MQCNAKTTDGKPCRAHPQSNSDYCFTHDPERKKERARARQLGGENRRVTFTRTEFPDCYLSTLDGLLDFTEAVIHETWALGSSVGRVKALCQMTQVQKDLLLALQQSTSGANKVKERYEKYQKKLASLTSDD